MEQNTNLRTLLNSTKDDIPQIILKLKTNAGILNVYQKEDTQKDGIRITLLPFGFKNPADEIDITDIDVYRNKPYEMKREARPVDVSVEVNNPPNERTKIVLRREDIVNELDVTEHKWIETDPDTSQYTRFEQYKTPPLDDEEKMKDYIRFGIHRNTMLECWSYIEFCKNSNGSGVIKKKYNMDLCQFPPEEIESAILTHYNSIEEVIADYPKDYQQIMLEAVFEMRQPEEGLRTFVSNAEEFEEEMRKLVNLSTR